MSEPYWEPLGGLVPGPAGPQGAQGAAGSVPVRLDAAGITGTNRPDANACTENGYYVVYAVGTPAASNLPPGVNHAYIHVVAYDPSYLVQYCNYLYGEQVWTRRRTNGTWGTWMLKTPMTGVHNCGNMNNDTLYGFNVYFPLAFQTVPVVFCTLNTWYNNQTCGGPWARDITLDHFDLYIYNYANANVITVRWMAFNSF